MEDMLVNRKGHVVCEVEVNKPTIGRLWWEDLNGKEMVGTTTETVKDGKKISSLSLEITFDEWSRGIELQCIVEHSNWIAPLKRLYKRTIGKKTIHKFWTESLSLFPVVLLPNLL